MWYLFDLTNLCFMKVFADGLRNEVGLAFDKFGTLWGVENGADQLNRPDLGGDIHNGNPAEEMNRFNGSVGQHYGYPYCFSTDNLPGYAKGTQFAWPTFMNDGTHTDEWCRNATNVNRFII
jgi:glucose/arabinose dehydrogenase